MAVLFSGSQAPSLTMPRPNFVGVGMLLASVALAAYEWQATNSAVLALAILAVGFVLSRAPRVAQQWERAVVLRLGRFVGLRGPGLPIPYRSTSTRCSSGWCTTCNARRSKCRTTPRP